MRKAKSMSDFEEAVHNAGSLSNLEKTATPYEALLLAISRRGSIRSFSRAIGVSPQYVNDWLGSKQTPVKWCRKIEEETGVSRKKLRPDIFN